MRFNLSKNKYLWLYLSCIAIQCSTIEAKNTKIITQADIINMCNKISWKVSCNNTIYKATDGAWIKNEYYKDSIRKVIGIAIADCITESNEFAKKNNVGIITFDTEPTHYTPENWNAVVLYNYLNEIKNDFVNNHTRGRDTIYKELFDKVYNYYNDNYKVDNLRRKIEKAVSDIKEYDEALHIKEHVDKSLRIIDDVLKIGRERNTREINELHLNKIPSDTTNFQEMAPGVAIVIEYPSKKHNGRMIGYFLQLTRPIYASIESKEIKTAEVSISDMQDGNVILDIDGARIGGKYFDWYDDEIENNSELTNIIDKLLIDR